MAWHEGAMTTNTTPPIDLCEWPVTTPGRQTCLHLRIQNSTCPSDRFFVNIQLIETADNIFLYRAPVARYYDRKLLSGCRATQNSIAFYQCTGNRLLHHQW